MERKLSQNQLKTYLEMLLRHGEDGLYRKVLGQGIIRYAANIKNPEVDLLDISEAFFSAYRAGGDDKFFIIGKVLRRAAHTLYRQLKHDKDQNTRFLNAVRG